MEFRPEHAQAIRRIISESVSEALADVKVRAVPDADEHHLSETLFISIIGFQSEKMQGSVVLGCDEEFLRRTCPGLTGTEENPEAFIYDWIGELSNLIMGRIKNKLLPYGVVLKLNPPSITESTESIFDSYSARKPSEKVWFSTEKDDSVCLLLTSDIDETIDFDVMSEKKGLEPGTGIMRLKSFDMYGDNAGNLGAQVTKPGTPVFLSDELDPDMDDNFEDISDEDFDDEEFVEKKFDDLPNTLDVSDQIEKETKSKIEVGSHEGFVKENVANPQTAGVFNSIRYLDNGRLEIQFDKEVVFLLHLETLYTRNIKDFEVQGHRILLNDEGLGIQVFIDGISVTIYKERVA